MPITATTVSKKVSARATSKPQKIAQKPTKATKAAKVAAPVKNTKKAKRVEKVEPAAKRTYTKGGSYKDVQISYLAEGISAVRQGFESEKFSTKAIRDALNNFKSNGNPVRDFEAFAAEVAAPKPRGRPSVEIGGVRSYKAQQAGDKAVFLRLPLASLNCAPGDELVAQFENNRIVITTKSASA